MENVDSEKYLGDTIMANGSNKLNFKKRTDKGGDRVSQKTHVLERRNVILRNGMSPNQIYNFKQKVGIPILHTQ